MHFSQCDEMSEGLFVFTSQWRNVLALKTLTRSQAWSSSSRLQMSQSKANISPFVQHQKKIFSALRLKCETNEKKRKKGPPPPQLAASARSLAAVLLRRFGLKFAGILYGTHYRGGCRSSRSSDFSRS